MKTTRIFLITLVMITLASCTFPLPEILQRQTPTPLPTETPTPTPLPTATPTPVPSVRLDRGMAFFAQGNWDDAEKEFQDVLAFSNDDLVNASALSMIGRIYYHRGDDVSALDYLRRAINNGSNPDASAAAHFHLALIYEKLTRYAEAAAEYQAYLDLKPGVLDAYMLTKLGDALTNAGSLAEANTAYTRAISVSGGKDLTLDLKVANNLVSLQDYGTALDRYNFIYNASTSEYTKAQVDLLVGRIYLTQGDPASAYARFQDAVDNYPRAYDSYSALVALVNDNQPVNLLNRGIINYNVGQYYLAIDILKQYMDENPVHDGTPHYYRAYAYTYAGEYDNAISEWETLIADHPGDRYYATAWDEKAYTQWYYLNKHAEAAQTLSVFLSNNPLDGMAPVLLFEMGRIYERVKMLEEAASTWERLPGEYPSSEYAYMGIFFSGISRYRLQQWDAAQTAFQRALLLATQPGEKAGAYFWMGKTSRAQGSDEAAGAAWQAALEADPTGYYSERARDMLLNRQMIQRCETMDLAVDLNADRPEAEKWLKDKFGIAPETNLSDMSSILQDARMQQAAEFWRLGLYENARLKVEEYREEFKNDPVIQYKLANWLVDLGMYRSAILSARQVLTLAGMDDTATLNAPLLFNHIRFGVYYRELVLQIANEMDLDPMLIFSVMRQESLFEPFITSSAGAEGLMQMLPGTARDVSTQSGWYPDLKDEDIYRPQVAIRMGSYYLKQQFIQQNGFTPAALAAYNGGPGNASAWRELSGDDLDLYLEVVRFQETRNYIRAIVEIYNIYRSFYCR